MNTERNKTPPPRKVPFTPRKWKKSKEKGDKGNLANIPVKSGSQGSVLVEERM